MGLVDRRNRGAAQSALHVAAIDGPGRHDHDLQAWLGGNGMDLVLAIDASVSEYEALCPCAASASLVLGARGWPRRRWADPTHRIRPRGADRAGLHNVTYRARIDGVSRGATITYGRRQPNPDSQPHDAAGPDLRGSDRVARCRSLAGHAGVRPVAVLGEPALRDPGRRRDWSPRPTSSSRRGSLPASDDPDYGTLTCGAPVNAVPVEPAVAGRRAPQRSHRPTRPRLNCPDASRSRPPRPTPGGTRRETTALSRRHRPPVVEASAAACALDCQIVCLHTGIGGQPVDEQQRELLIGPAVDPDVHVRRPTRVG